MPVKPARKAVLAEADALIDAFYPSTKQAVDGLYAAWSGNAKVRSAINALNVGESSPGEFIQQVIEAFQSVNPRTAQVFAKNGITAGELFQNVYGLNAPLNAELWADQFAGQRIASLREASIDAVRDYVSRSLETGTPLNNLARDIEGVVKLDKRFTTATVNRHKALIARSGARSGTQRNVSAYINRSAKVKSEQIARTELAIAQNHGRYQSLYAARAAGLLDDTDLMVWIAAPDCCDLCSTYNGMTASIDDGFGTSTGAVFPPLHPNCRCTFGIK